MQRLDQAFSLWSRAHARLLQAEHRWSTLVLYGSREEQRALECELLVLRERSDALLREASEALERAQLELPRS